MVRVSPLPRQGPKTSAQLETATRGDGFALLIATDVSRLAHLYLDPAATKKAKDAALVAALHSVLRREGRLDLHAAAVARPDGDAILIVGPKGAGKSSLTIALALSGWTLLSDDYVLAWSGETGLSVGSLRHALFLLPDAVERLPAGSRAGQFVPAMGKHMFQPSQIFQGQHRTQAGIAAIVFPERRPGAPSRLERLRPATAFRRLLASSPFLATDVSARPCLAVARALADLPAFVLHGGPDLLDPSKASRVMIDSLR